MGLGSEMQRLSVSRAALDWWKAEHFARMLGRQRDVAMLSYEALCQSPQRTLAKALASAQIGNVKRPNWVDHRSVQPGQDYHSLNGNPDRFDQGALRITARKADWSTHPVSDRFASKFIGGALAALYRPPQLKIRLG
jgi:hypothetical protein